MNLRWAARGSVGRCTHHACRSGAVRGARRFVATQPAVHVPQTEGRNRKTIHFPGRIGRADTLAFGERPIPVGIARKLIRAGLAPVGDRLRYRTDGFRSLAVRVRRARWRNEKREAQNGKTDTRLYAHQVGPSWASSKRTTHAIVVGLPSGVKAARGDVRRNLLRTLLTDFGRSAGLVSSSGLLGSRSCGSKKKRAGRTEKASASDHTRRAARRSAQSMHVVWAYGLCCASNTHSQTFPPRSACPKRPFPSGFVPTGTRSVNAQPLTPSP